MAVRRRQSRRNWREYRPSKTLWLCSLGGVAVLTVAVGFVLGGWVAGGTAQRMAAEAAAAARARLVAEVCVERYISADRFASRFAELKDAGTFKREDIIAEGRWTDLPGVEEPVGNAARLCANELVRMHLPSNPANESGEGESGFAG